VLAASFSGCDSGSSDADIADDCSIAFASPDDSYAQFVNLLNVHISVRYDDRPLGATVSKRSCDLLGVFADAPESFTVRRCESGELDEEGAPVDCGFAGPMRRISVSASAGEMERVMVNGGFFE
jgi:hypothetical protein